MGERVLYSFAMNQTYTQWLIGAVVVIVLAGAGFFFWKHTTPAALPATDTATTTSQTPVISVGPDGTVTSSNSGYTVTQVPVSTTTSVPDYKSPLTCGSDIPPDVCTRLKEQAADAAARIDKDKNDGNAWINLGTIRKIADDYKGAEAAWSYVTKLFPGNPIAFSNLGDLYMNFLHDYAKAEANYKAAIQAEPTGTSFYADLFSLYTNTSYRPTATAAEDILKAGIAANPKAIDLPVALARYYKSLGRTADAQAQYDSAIANAKAAGKTDIAAQIQAEADEK